jgi:tetratricopeptide (TPR) repeat protein
MSGDPRVRGLVEEILETHRAPEEVCQACPELLPEVLDRLRRLGELEAQVDSWFPTPGSIAESFEPPDGRFPQISGYEIQAILGRGGMGIVYKARHLRLSRVVALKMLQAGAYAGARERARFQREAQVVAGLRHANIVQVYDVGDHEGCPYFTMELLDGGSLAQALAGTPQPARQAAALLITLAEAVQVAHQAGIVHRDLKPGNILLAAPGAPKVADFGLAQNFEGEAALTLSGTRMGTPSYMAPEQVSGKAGTIGPATDIYALGALLYEMLTGRPPFRGETASETERQVVHEEPVSPSRLNTKVPRDLETICLKCLSKEPQRRYASAVALADDLRRFTEGRPIQARPLGWGGRLWRWGRRKPTTAGLLATLLALFVLTVGGGLELGRRDAERQGRAREAVEAALAQVPGLRRLGRWPEAQAVLAQGRSRLEEAGSDDLRRRLVQADEDLRLAAVLERIRLTPAIEASRFDYRGMADAYARAFQDAGLDVRGDEGAVAARIGASELRSQLVMALDHWAYVADALEDGQSMARLLRLARRADPDPRWGDRFRDPALWRDLSRLRRLAEEAEQRLAGVTPESGPPTALVTLLAKKLGQQDGQAEPLLRAAQGRHPEDFWLNYALGQALRERKPAEAVGFYRAALVTRPTVAEVQYEVGVALWRQGQWDEAIRAGRKAIELEATKARYHHDLGLCLQARGLRDEAMVEYRRAIELDPKAAVPHHQLGACWQEMSRLDEAMAEYRRAIELDPKMAASHHQLGLCWQARGRLDEAMAEYRRAIELDPKGAPGHHQLGTCWQGMGRLDEAMAEYRRAIELDPKGGAAYYHLGTCWRARGRLDEATAEFRRAVEFDPGGSLGHVSLAEALFQSGRFAEARTAIRRGLELLPADEPRRPALREKLVLCERMLALDARLPALLQGEERPVAAEHLELARLCRDYGRPYAAAVLSTAAFAARPALADDLDTGERYYAACAAARAAAGEGTDATRLGRPERAGLRRRALAWLRADLELRTRLGKSVDWALTIWQTETALSGVRDRASLAKLPADECEEWRRLWADVDASLAAADTLRQGRACAARRDWARAADCYARGLTRGPTDDGHFWFEYAALLLLSGDRPGYVKACAHLVDRCGNDKGPRSYHVARACTLAPEAVADTSLPGRLAEKELEASARQFWSLAEQGALAYRAGRFQEAVPFFEQSLQADPKPGRAVLNWLWLALANQRLGQADEARRWLNKARAWLDQYRDELPARAEEEFGLHLHNWLEAHVLRREAEALIPSAGARSGPENRERGAAQK